MRHEHFSNQRAVLSIGAHKKIWVEEKISLAKRAWMGAIELVSHGAQWAAGGDFHEKRKNKNAEKGKKEKLKRKD